MKSETFKVLAALCVAGLAAGLWTLLHPAAFWLQPWRPEPTVVDARFIFGPYPVEADFKNLEKRGATTIISLLDASLPHENILLAQETELAQQHHMRVLDIPVAGILGPKTAADAALASNGTVYVHGYLGLGRAENVRQLLLQTKAADSAAAVDRVKTAYAAGRMDDVLKETASIPVMTPEIRSMEAWANYRLNRIDEAQAVFARLQKDRPDLLDAAIGLGYCALRRNNLVEAARQFEQATSQTREYTAAVEGLGYVRYRQGRADEARTLFTRVLAANPDNAEVRQLLNRIGEGTKSPAATAP